MKLGTREIGQHVAPLVIAELGINANGDEKKQFLMIADAAAAGCDCVKTQIHIPEEELCPESRSIIPSNATESIWDMMTRCGTPNRWV